MRTSDSNQSPTTSANSQDAVLSCVRDMFFRVDGFSGTTHFVDENDKPLCGTHLKFRDERTQVKIEDMELKELWGRGTDWFPYKWVKVSKHDKCKRCMSALEKNYL